MKQFCEDIYAQRLPKEKNIKSCFSPAGSGAKTRWFTHKQFRCSSREIATNANVNSCFRKQLQVPFMKNIPLQPRFPSSIALLLIFASSAFAQSDPWTASANNLKTAFTGPLATALIAVAVVVTGMVFAFSEGQGKRQLAGLTFGGAMALGAVRFMSWLFT